ncbi:zinc ribbon domain-containing protein [Nonomuraea dietziae]|uniref:zinc ribbon domain-containing protein n=1 Tax=Nonomuraea dietziae TaxID=65515 RepID=UPI0031E35684
MARVGRCYPSSQLCPCCGWRVGAASPGGAGWDCSSCGEHHDRDIAAAINILLQGQRVTVVAGLAGHGKNDCGGQVRPGAATPTLAQPESCDARAAQRKQ